MIQKYLKYSLLAVFVIVFTGCTKKDTESVSSESKEPAATVHNPVQETTLTSVTLSSEAEQRLELETAVVEYRSVDKNRTYSGEIVPVSGGSVTVAAPVSGTLRESPGVLISAGTRVEKDQPLLLLLELPQQDILSIQEEISVRRVELDLAQKELDRSEQLLEDRAGSAREMEEAQAEFDKAMGSLRAAEAKLELLRPGETDIQDRDTASMVVRSPVDGVIQQVYVAPGQVVTDATELLEISRIDPVWIKVPVYAGDLDIIDIQQPAKIHNLADFVGAKVKTADPVEASYSADSQSVTVDLFYEISNEDLSYRPGQKVGVTLALKADAQSLVVPYSAILYDMFGSAWVYENTATHVYTRRRVELYRVQDDIAVISRGIEAGTKIVTAGSVELFGTEFGESGGH